MAGIKADWAHTKAASMLRDSEGFTTPIYPCDVSRLADALRETDKEAYERGIMDERKRTLGPYK